MRYISTRGTAPVLNFEEAMLSGLARDGGLYVPETIPQLSADDIASMEGQSYESAPGVRVCGIDELGCSILPSI